MIFMVLAFVLIFVKTDDPTIICKTMEENPQLYNVDTSSDVPRGVCTANLREFWKVTDTSDDTTCSNSYFIEAVYENAVIDCLFSYCGKCEPPTGEGVFTVSADLITTDHSAKAKCSGNQKEFYLFCKQVDPDSANNYLLNIEYMEDETESKPIEEVEAFCKSTGTNGNGHVTRANKIVLTMLALVLLL